MILLLGYDCDSAEVTHLPSPNPRAKPSEYQPGPRSKDLWNAGPAFCAGTGRQPAAPGGGVGELDRDACRNVDSRVLIDHGPHIGIGIGGIIIIPVAGCRLREIDGDFRRGTEGPIRSIRRRTASVVSIDEVYHDLYGRVLVLWLAFGDHQRKSNERVIAYALASIFGVEQTVSVEEP